MTKEQDGRILARNKITGEETTVELSVAVEQELAQAMMMAIRSDVGSLGKAGEVELSDLEGALVQALRQVGAKCLEVLVGAAGTGYEGYALPSRRR